MESEDLDSDEALDYGDHVEDLRINTNSTNASNHDAAVIAAIVERISAKTFPLVLPNEQVTESKESAVDVLQWVQKCEAVELQSYLDEKWKVFREHAIYDYWEPEPVRQAKWARQEYYFHVRQFQASHKSDRNLIFEGLQVLMAPGECNGVRLAELRQITSSIHAEAADDVDRHIEKAWKLFQEELPEWARLSDASMKASWFSKSCVDIMRSFPRSPVAAFSFVPELALTDIADDELRATARQIFSQVREADVPHIAQATAAAYALDMEKIPEYLHESLGSEFRKNFLLQHYVNIVRQVTSKAIVEEAWVFRPTINLEDMSDESSRSEAASLYAKVQSFHVARIDELVLTRFNADVASIDENIIRGCADQLRRNWLKKHYVEVVREVLGSTTAHSPARASSASTVQAPARVSSVSTEAVSRVSVSPRRSPARAPSISSQTISNVFVSPKKRARTAASATAGVESQPRSFTIGQFHTELGLRTDANVVKAAVLHFVEPHMVTVPDRKTKASVDVAVISILLADSTAPILLELWRDAAEKAFRELTQWLTESNDTLWVEVRYMWVRTEKGVCHPSIRKLIGNERTTITRCAPMIVAAEVPPEELHFRDFSVLQATPPFTVNVTGVIMEVEDETTSQSGLPTKNFKLQDRSSRYVMCTACGRHADNVLIRSQNEVTFFLPKHNQDCRVVPGLCGCMTLPIFCLFVKAVTWRGHV